MGCHPVSCVHGKDVSVAPNSGMSMRNPLLGVWHHPHCRPEMDHKPVALVGFREWIFSQDSGGCAGAGWQDTDWCGWQARW